MQMGCKEKNRFIHHLPRELNIECCLSNAIATLLLLSNSFTDPGAAEKY